MTGKLNRKLELWELFDTTNELGEVYREERLLKYIWCEILPKHGNQSSLGDTSLDKVTLKLNIRCRKKSVKNPSIDMFFKFKNESQKYQVVDWIPDFKTNVFIEFLCEVIYE